MTFLEQNIVLLIEHLTGSSELERGRSAKLFAPWWRLIRIGSLGSGPYQASLCQGVRDWKHITWFDLIGA